MQPIFNLGSSENISQVYERFGLQEFLNPHPMSSYFMRVDGNAMRDAGICSGDIVLVDRSLEPINNKIVVAAYNGQFLLRWYYCAYHRIELLPGNPNLETIVVKSSDRLEIWGLVAAVIRKV